MKRFLAALAIATVGYFALGSAILPANADAHGWHWTKCRSKGRWIRGHQGVNWYGPFYGSFGCSGTWELWEYYAIATPIWK